jgi:hypothetical protein
MFQTTKGRRRSPSVCPGEEEKEEDDDAALTFKEQLSETRSRECSREGYITATQCSKAVQITCIPTRTTPDSVELLHSDEPGMNGTNPPCRIWIKLIVARAEVRAARVQDSETAMFSDSLASDKV